MVVAVVVPVSTATLMFVLMFLRFGVVLMAAGRAVFMLLRFGLSLLFVLNSFLEVVPGILISIRTELTVNMLVLADMAFFVGIAFAEIAQVGVLMILLTVFLHDEVIDVVSDSDLAGEEGVAVGFVVAVGPDGWQFEGAAPLHLCVFVDVLVFVAVDGLDADIAVIIPADILHAVGLNQIQLLLCQRFGLSEYFAVLVR